MHKHALLLLALGLPLVAGCPETNSSVDVGLDTRNNADIGATLDTGSTVDDTGSTVDDTGSTVGDTGTTTGDTGTSTGDTGPMADAGMCVDLPATPTRPAPVTCSPCRVPTTAEGGGGECASDADCTTGANGRCTFGRVGRFCSYDECFADSDCESNEVCLCDGASGGGNTCITTSCRTNNDCGGETCSPTLGSCGHFTGFTSYACHTASDECRVDADCGEGYCAFDAAVSHWICSTSECVG